MTNESRRKLKLGNWHLDIQKLAALALPDVKYRSKEMISANYFLDALIDPNFALKIPERYADDLDSASRITVGGMDRGQQKTKARKPKTIRRKPKKTKKYVTKPSASVASATKRWNEMLLEELKNRVPKLYALVTPAVEQLSEAPSASKQNQALRKPRKNVS